MRTNVKKFRLALTTLTLVALMLSVFGAVPTWAGGPWYVDANTGNDGNDCLSTTSACKTIGAAIGNASNGDTINVAAGTYAEGVTLTPGTDLTITGAGRDVATWICPSDGYCIDGSMSGYTGSMSYEISGFTFNCRSDPAAGHGTGIGVRKARDGSLDLSIHDNRFVENLASADSTHWATSMLLCHNRVAARDGSGNAPVHIYNNIDETLGGMTMSNSQAYDIYNNVFDGCSDAIYNGHGCPDTAGNTFGDHHIYGNTFMNASDAVHPGGLTPAIDWQYYGAGDGTHLPSIIEDNLFQDNDTAIRFVMDTDMTYPAHQVRFNNFTNNGFAIRVDGAYSSTVNAENNWWGSVYGPQDDTGSTEGLAPCEGGWNCDTCDKNTEPAGQLGDKVSENVDYCPWSLATLWLNPCGGWVENGENVTVDVMMTSSGFNGVEFDLEYDDSLLTFVSVVKGSMWDGYDTNVMQATGGGGTIEFAAFLQEADTTLDVTQAQVATITFTGLADGESDLTFANTIVSNPDGEELGVSLETGCTLTVHGHGSVEGDVELQGRFVAGGSLVHHAGASVKITGGPGGGFEYNGSTDASGHWEITDVIEGDYDVEVEMGRYLNAERSASGQVTLSAGGSVDADFVKLLGGDCDGNARVGSLDAAIVGPEFGNSDPGIGDMRADINDDYKVNILDCAILGGNYGKVGPLAW